MISGSTLFDAVVVFVRAASDRQWLTVREICDALGSKLGLEGSTTATSLHQILYQDNMRPLHRGQDVDILSALDAATDEFGRRLSLVSEDAWTLPTPCPDWDVHYLAAHVIGGNRFASHILGGMPAMEAIEQIMATPQLGDNPLGAWASTSAMQATAFNADAALERQIDHPLGQISGREFLAFRVFDITLHAWDLARAIGADEQLAPDLVDVVLNVVENGPPGMGFGITALGQVPASASAQAKLLDLTGRMPT